ncbi:MAG TPA: hypothetical protein PLM70_03395 [Bacteroidales bacterium]|nr:hypothetical protein [Bacteroidales bacterium]
MEKQYFKKITFLTILFFSCFFGFAQEKGNIDNPEYNKHEFSIAIGAVPIPASPYNLVLEFLTLDSWFGSDDQYVPMIALDLSYVNNIRKKYGLGVSFSYSLKKSSYCIIEGNSLNLFSLFFINKFTYIKKPNFTMYSKASIGIDYYLEEHSFLPDLHLCLIGFSFGQKVAILTEIGYGTQGIFKLGVQF